MRLTKYTRQGIVDAILDDVPEIDYSEMIQKAVTDWAVSIMPPKVRAVWDDKSLRHYVQLDYFSEDLCWDNQDHEGGSDDIRSAWINGFIIPVPDDLHRTMPSAVVNKLIELDELRREQRATMDGLKTKLRGVIDGCTTTQQFIKQLPEFEKYVPKEEPTTKNLPALANLVTDFVKAGWPKGGKPLVQAQA